MEPEPDRGAPDGAEADDDAAGEGAPGGEEEEAAGDEGDERLGEWVEKQKKK